MVTRSVTGRRWAVALLARSSVAAVMATSVLLAPQAAHAQSREADAERFFREGQKLMEERRFGEACPKFEAAYRKDGALGTLLNLAFCHKEQGATWYAWLEFREAEVKATEQGLAERRDFAHARLVELEKSLHKVVLDNPRKVQLTDVLVEDRKVWEPERGFATESGSRKLTFRARGKRPASKLVELKTGPRVQHITVPDMADLTEEDLPPPAAVVVPTPEPPRRDVVVRAAPPVEKPSSTQRTLGWVGIGIGSGAAALGIATGAISTFGPCGHSACSSSQRDAASTTAAVSTVSFITAGALVVTGLVLLVTAPSTSSASRSGPTSGSTSGSSSGRAVGAAPGWPFAFTF